MVSITDSRKQHVTAIRQIDEENSVEVKRVALVLADISGYTAFMRHHDTSILHAEQIITELLETVIDSSDHPLQVSKIEGDAVFFYAVADDDAATAKDVLRQAVAFSKAFAAKERELIGRSYCTCDACTQIDKLKLKIILHFGDVAFKRVKHFEELAGRDVILIHRLLKNSIPSKEYILMTKAFNALAGELPGQRREARTEDAEGIGKVEMVVFYPDQVAQPVVQPVVQNPTWQRAAFTTRLLVHMWLRKFGLARPVASFENMPN